MMRMGGFGRYIGRVVQRARALRFTARTDLPLGPTMLALGTAAALGVCFAIGIEKLETGRTGPPAELETQARASLVIKPQAEAAAGGLLPNDTITAPADLLAQPPYATWTLFLLPGAAHSTPDEIPELSAEVAAAEPKRQGWLTRKAPRASLPPYRCLSRVPA